MTTTLLNPACDPCYDCTECCDDWYDPNEWYFWLDNVADTAYNSAANATLDTANNRWYYWDNNAFLTVLETVVNFQFAGTEPSYTAGGGDVYQIVQSVPELDCAADLHTAIDSFGSPVLPYATHNVVFDNFQLDLRVVLRCDLGTNGKRGILSWILNFDYSCAAGSGSTYLASNGSTTPGGVNFYDCPDQIFNISSIARRSTVVPRIVLPGIVSAEFPILAITDPYPGAFPEAYQGRAVTHFAPP